MTRRDILMMVAHLLDAINRYPTMAFSRQFNAANLNETNALVFIELLESRSFIRKVPTRKNHFNYHITNKGLDFLNQINLCYEAISPLENKPNLEVLQFA